MAFVVNGGTTDASISDQKSINGGPLIPTIAPKNPERPKLTTAAKTSHGLLEMTSMGVLIPGDCCASVTGKEGLIGDIDWTSANPREQAARTQTALQKESECETKSAWIFDRQIGKAPTLSGILRGAQFSPFPALK